MHCRHVEDANKASESLLSRAGDAVVDYGKDMYSQAVEGIKAYPATIPKKLGNLAVDKAESALMEKYVYDLLPYEQCSITNLTYSHEVHSS